MVRTRSGRASVVVALGLSAVVVAVSVCGALAAHAPTHPAAPASATGTVTGLTAAPHPSASPTPPSSAAAGSAAPAPDAGAQVAPAATNSPAHGAAPQAATPPQRPAPVPIAAAVPTPVAIDPPPTILDYHLSVNCGSAITVNADVTATGHPSITDVTVRFNVPGWGYDSVRMQVDARSWGSETSPSVPAGDYAITVQMFVFDSNGQEASRTMTFPVTCSGP